MKDFIEDARIYDLVIVDAMNLCARMHHGHRSLSHNGKPTGMLYGVLKKVFQLKRNYPKAEIRFLWEGQESKRKTLSNSYKSSRVRGEDDFRSCVGEVRKLLTSAGVSDMCHLGLEADDCAAYISATEDPTKTILMISNDEDWIQYVKANVDLERSAGSGETEADLHASLGFSPSKMGMWKVLKGDKSDDIKGIMRIPSAVVRLLMNKCEVLEDLREYPLSKHNPVWERWEKAIKDDWEHLKNNAQLIIYQPEWIVPEQILYSEGKMDYNILRATFEKYNMKSLLREIDG